MQPVSHLCRATGKQTRTTGSITMAVAAVLGVGGPFIRTRGPRPFKLGRRALRLQQAHAVVKQEREGYAHIASVEPFGRQKHVAEARTQRPRGKVPAVLRECWRVCRSRARL
eukprot:820530-Pleurochrysis_carterae.AAC.2